MKKLILGLMAIMLVTAVGAQDGKKSLRQANRALGSFNLDPANNKEKLKEAVAEIKDAVADPETAKDAGAWVTKGQIFNEVANQLTAIRQLGVGDETSLPQVDDPAHEAYESFMKAYELAEKKYETKDAMEGLQKAQGNLSNLGIFKFESGDYQGAFENFRSVIKAHDVLKKENYESALDTEEDFNNQMYITGLAALNANQADAAADYFKKLYKAGFDKPAIYEALYKIEAENDINAAYAYLEEGRKQFPDDISLLFAEINHFLRINKLDELITKLELAIEKEPENVSLYSTMGNVYDNLYQRESKAGNEEKAQEYFDKALNYYNQALEIDPKFADAVYSIGALYYNKAASMTLELNKYADDYSKEGLAKYEKLKEQIFEQFDKALPYFQKAEALAPNDLNTLIALKEIYARKDNLEMSNKFKERLEKVQAGEKLEEPYFDANNN